MKSFITTVLPSLVTILAATAQAADCPAADAPVCEISDASPSVSNCQRYTDMPDNYRGGCGYPYGSSCNTDVTIGDCSLVFCQDDGAEPVCLDLDQTHCIGTWMQQLIDDCQSNGKVGGYVHVPYGDSYLNVELV